MKDGVFATRNSLILFAFMDRIRRVGLQGMLRKILLLSRYICLGRQSWLVCSLEIKVGFNL